MEFESSRRSLLVVVTSAQFTVHKCNLMVDACCYYDCKTAFCRNQWTVWRWKKQAIRKTPRNMHSFCQIHDHLLEIYWWKLRFSSTNIASIVCFVRRRVAWTVQKKENESITQHNKKLVTHSVTIFFFAIVVSS